MTVAAAPLEELVQQAKTGDVEALEGVIVAVQDRVYRLAMRMLSDPTDAEDATQEILVKVATSLGSFRGESAFTTWVYRLASNYLLNTRRRRAEQLGLTFDAFGELLEQGLAFDAARSTADSADPLLEEEVKLTCTQSMLLCLDREHRLAFILGEVLEVNSQEAATILGISPEAFRKRLSRARERLRTFMIARCGLVSEESPCRCARQVPFAIQAGLVNPEQPRLTTHPAREADAATTVARMRELEQLERTTAVFRSQPAYAAPTRFAGLVKDLVDSGRFEVLSA